jgi:hypothetical protein
MLYNACPGTLDFQIHVTVSAVLLVTYNHGTQCNAGVSCERMLTEHTNNEWNDHGTHKQ